MGKQNRPRKPENMTIAQLRKCLDDLGADHSGVKSRADLRKLLADSDGTNASASDSHLREALDARPGELVPLRLDCVLVGGVYNENGKLVDEQVMNPKQPISIYEPHFDDVRTIIEGAVAKARAASS